MKPSIGLGAPVAALFAFALMYNPKLLPYFPEDPTLKLLSSPQIFFLLASAIVVFTRNLPPRLVGIRFDRLKTDLKLGIVLSLSPAVLTVISAAILTIAHQLYPFLPRPFLGGPSVEIHFAWQSLFSLIVLAPISEELFFRGILLRAIRERYSATASVLLSSLIFMGAHGGLALGPFLLGLITGIAYLRTSSILPGMLFHSVANAYAPLLVWYFPNLYRYLKIFFQ